MNRALGLGVGLLVLLALAAPHASVVAAQEDSASTGNDSGVRHVNPDSTSDDGDSDALESYLSEQLGSHLSESAIQISQGEYDRAKGVLGEEYRSALDKYVDVAGETGNEDTAETFRETRERQRDFANSTQAYRQTLRAYREAKQNGNDERARRLARELEEQADAIVQNGSSLRRTYGTLTNETTADFGEAETAVNLTIENVTEQQAQVRDVEFVATNLTIRAESTRLSFADPLRISGRLTLENGTAIGGRRIALRIHNRTVTTRTDVDGRFTAQYRPITLPADAGNVTVRYVPNATSILFGSNASVPVEVTQVDSTVVVQNSTDSAAYNDSVAATARVTAAGTPVPGLPVALSVDGRRLATGRTTENGTVAMNGTLPIGVRSGDRSLQVAIATPSRAVARSAATRALSVSETATDLTVQATTSDTTVTVSGRLTTANGGGAAGQAVEVRRDGTTVTSVQTGPEGTYRARFERERGQSYRITTVYDDPSTNLGPATAQTTVAVSRPGGDGSSPGLLAEVSGWVRGLLPWSGGGIGGYGNGARVFVTNNPALVGVGLLVLLLGGVALLVSRRGIEGEVEESTQTQSAVTRNDAATDDGDVLAAARSFLDTDATAAVERAYRGVRWHLQARGIGTSAATHWEFYRACRAADIDDVDALEELTETYEQAAFGHRTVSSGDAESAIEQASQFT